MIRSTYNKNAWDLAKDELDAALNVVESRAEIRQVLMDHDMETKKRASIFGTGGSAVQGEEEQRSAAYQDLPKEGSPVVMQLEMSGSADALQTKKEGKKKGSASKKKGTGGTVAKVGKKK